MQGFQDKTSWLGRNPYMAGANGRPSLSALSKLSQLQGVSPTDTPYSDEESELAFGQQADEAEGRMNDWSASGGATMSPMQERARGNAIGGGQWADFSDALDRSQLMAGNRGLKSRIDLIGQGPGTGTGLGRWSAQSGHANPFGSFSSTEPDVDVEGLTSDASTGPDPYTRSTALQALRRLFGR